ncbi:unnamed protein product [Allacma fusca]|uniref:Sulfotransferase n=1 Tax=Allacma fusca TaxID=39272 RepID=A0A8J2J0G6_9HEXA|nr:unnamed protein product [Allacma fusca]
MSGSFRKFNKPSSSSNIAERAIGLFTDENITTTCDCNAYCAQVKKGKDTEPGYTYTNILRSSFLSNYSKGSGQQAIDINKSGKNKTGSSLEGKPNHGKFSLSVKRAILQIQQFSKKYQITKLVQEGLIIFRRSFILSPGYILPLRASDVFKHGVHVRNRKSVAAGKHSKILSKRWRICHTSQCMELKEKCFDFVFLNTSCKIFPVQVFKLTRIRGQAAEELLKRFSNSKIIYLVRDPRAIYSSRMKVGWCPAQSPCGNTSLLCNDLEKDLAEIRTLQAKQAQNVLTGMLMSRNI